MKSTITSLATRTCVVALLTLTVAPKITAQQNTPALRVTLADAIGLALDQGYQALAAEATREAARYRNDAFYSRLLPQLSLTGQVPTYNRSIIPVLQPDGSTLFRPQDQTNVALGATVTQAIPTTGTELFVSSSLERISLSGTDNVLTWSSTPVLVGLRQPILRPNTLRWERREQPVRTEFAERQYLEDREGIALQTNGLFFDVYAARVDLDNANGNAAVNDTLYRLNTGRYDIGTIGENDLLQSELALLQARTNLDGATLAHQRAMAALRLALNVEPGLALEIVIPTAIPTFDADTARAVAQALQNRAIVSTLELQDVQAQRQIAEAKMNNGWGATVEASFGFNATGSNVNRVYSNLLEARRFSVSVELPVLQWGARSETIHAAEADLDQLANTTQAALDQTAHEARFAALQLAQARRNLALSATADTVAQRRYDVAYNRYLIGRISIDNLFLGQREKDQARVQYVRALRGYWEAYYQLRRVTLYDFEIGQPIQ